MKYAVGIDIGGTFVKSGLVDITGKVIEKEKWPIRKDSREELLDQFVEIINYWQQKYGEQIVGAGIGIPGFINHKTGVLDKSPNLPVLDGARIFEEIAAKTSLPTVVENDANAAAWGEYWAGGGAEAELLVLLTLGTGVGSGIVWGGKIWHGSAGYAGEFGHSLVVPHGTMCNCGRRGCLETYFSATALIRDVKAALAAGKDSSLAKIDGPLKGKDIFDAAAAGDALAAEIVTAGAGKLGMAIGSLINILNPDQIVLGGGIIEAKDFIMPIVLAAAEAQAITGSFASCQISVSSLGNDAGLIGAGSVALQQFGEQ